MVLCERKLRSILHVPRTYRPTHCASQIYTKKSQWDKPTAPAYGPQDEGAPSGPPPGYNTGATRPVSSEKAANLYNPGQNVSEDERLARKLQEEENGKRGLSDSYYQGGASGGQYGQQQPSYGQQSGYAQQGAVQQGAYAPPQQQYAAQPEQKKGFLGKLLGSHSTGQPQYQQQAYGQPQYGYGHPQYVQQPARRTGGLGGNAALGIGGGLLGGMLLGDMIGDMVSFQHLWVSSWACN